jgi:hypothetical protein
MSQTASSLQDDTLCLRRPGLTRDLPPGKEDLQWVVNTATLIYGERDAAVVDTFLTVEQNQQLVDWIKAHDRNLAYIYVTHGHGDHAFGVKQLLEAFPGAKAVAAASVVAKATLEGTAPLIDDFWIARFPGQVPVPQVFPEALDGDTLTLEGHPQNCPRIARNGQIALSATASAATAPGLGPLPLVRRAGAVGADVLYLAGRAVACMRSFAPDRTTRPVNTTLCPGQTRCLPQ